MSRWLLFTFLCQYGIMAMWVALEGRTGESLYWAGSFLLTIGILMMRG